MASGGNSGRGVEVGTSVAVGLAVSVSSAAGTNSVGAFAVAVSFTLAIVVSYARVCGAGTSMVGPAGGLAAHADNKTRKRIADVMFVFMISPIFILHSAGRQGET
jgi:hypothetical protein